MPAASDVSTLLPYVIALLGGGGFVGAVVAFLKVKPEAGQLVIKAAEGAVIVQSGVIDDLREQLDAQRTRIEVLEKDKLNATWEAAKVRAENEILKARVKHLEAEVLHLQTQVTSEKRLGVMEKRMTAEEKRNTDIENFAADQAKKQERSEDRADDTEDHA